MRRLPVSTVPVLALLVLLAGCGGSEPTPPEPAIDRIVVTPATVSLTFLGEAVQLTARVIRDDGTSVSGAVVSWRAQDAGIATVDGTGQVTAVAPGSTDVIASFDGVMGSANVVVSTPDCVNEVSLSPGSWASFSLGCAIRIPGGQLGDRYRVAIVNQGTSESPSGVTTASLGVAAVPAASPQPAPASSSAALRVPRVAPALSRASARHLQLAELTARRTERRHGELRAVERRLWEELGADAVLRDRSMERRISAEGANAQLPSRLLLRANPGNSCSPEVSPAPALLIAENAEMAVYQDSLIWANGARRITTSQAQRILDYYSAHGRDVIEDYFHGVPDVDGNGKIILYGSYYRDIENGATAAYVWGGDLFDRDDCQASNEAELTYFNVALILELDQNFPQALETVVHEVKHISSFWQGIARSNRAGSARFQPGWLEEGTAEIASNVAARRAWSTVGGPSPTARLTGDMIQDSGADGNGNLLPEAFGVFLRLVRAHGYLTSQPNGVTNTPNGAEPSHDVYGSGWTFLRWLGDAYGLAASSVGADATLFTAQNDSTTAPGAAGIAQITGRTFAQLLEEYAAGVMLNGTEVQPARIAYDLYDFPDAIEIFCFAADNPPCEGSSPGPAGTWPWPVTTQSDGVMARGFETANFTGAIGVTGLRIHDFVSAGTNSIQIAVEAEQPAKVVVARIR